jgi:protein TonB
VAFDAYRRQDKGSSLARRVVFVLVAVAHGAVIAAGVVYSYWHVDELTPPTLRVTFISAAPPPPPPPPPPAGGSSRPKKVAIKTTPVTPVVVPKPTDIVQPREKPAPVVKKEFRKHDDEEEEEDDGPRGVKGGVKGGVIGGIAGGEVGGEVGGVVGGVKGGVLGGTMGGTGTGTGLSRKMLAPNMGKLQWDGCKEPEFPVSLRREGSSYTTTVKICVTKVGTVESVTLLKHSDSLIDANVVAAMKACRHRPLMADSLAVPFCYIQPFEFQVKR